MINTVYRLVAPRRFEIAFEDIDLFGDNAIVRPTNLSICNADMRYYLGTRDAKVLALALLIVILLVHLMLTGARLTRRDKKYITKGGASFAPPKFFIPAKP